MAASDSRTRGLTAADAGAATPVAASRAENLHVRVIGVNAYGPSAESRDRR